MPKFVRLVSCLTLATLIAVAGAPRLPTYAQSAPQQPPSSKDSNQSTEDQPVKTRGLFMLMLLPSIISSITQNVTGVAFNKMLGGEQQDTGTPIPSNSFAQAPSAPVANAKPASSSGDLEAGVAYQLLLRNPASGKEEPVDPTNYVFRTGQQFYVLFMTNMPGYVQAFNVDPGGIITRIAEGSVGGGDLSRLPTDGFFTFSGNPGTELLQIQLTPCRAPTKKAGEQVAQLTVRSILPVRDDVLVALPSCQAKSGQVAATPGKPITVQRDGITGIGVTPISADEISSGNIAPRTTLIQLQHAQ